MKGQIFIQFVVLDPYFVLHVSWLWWGGTPFLSPPDGPSLIFYHSDFWKTFLPWKTDCPETFHSVEIFFIFQHFWATCACPEKQSVSWIHCIEYIFLILIIQNFEQLALALKNRVCPETFHCVEISFIFQDFWGICACPENGVQTFHHASFHHATINHWHVITR